MALLGAWSAGEISYQHLFGEETCPELGSIPACFVVLAGYAAIVWAGITKQKTMLLLGWIPVFALAALGASFELLSVDPVCPQTANGIPKCYISLAVAASLGMLGWVSVFRAPRFPAG
ncbi:MAG: hypothetical protein ABJK59_03170 [Erythrobacter sp.]|uniref:hypothetical protein n=1 Tax=Erythrobacter sp. TaxID=1042 RepID=UPI003298D072